MSASAPPRVMNLDALPGGGLNMARARFYLFCALMALTVVSGVLLFGANYWRTQLAGLKNMLPPNVDMRLDRLTLSEIGTEGRTLVINATSALYNQPQDFFTLEEVRARVEHGSSTYDITSAAGRYDQAAKLITLTGQAKVADNEGGLLLSEKLVLNLGEGLLTGDQDFCYATPEYDLAGTAFVYRLRDKFLEVEGRTHLLF